MAEKEIKWGELGAGANKVILSFFKQEGPIDDNTMKRVKVATSVLSSYTRHEQTESAKEQTALIVARELSANKEEFATYLRVSIPRLSTLKAISTPSGN